MKSIKYIILLLLASFSFSSCMDGDWDNPNNDYAYGNDDLTESGVVTIAKLKSMYATELSTDYRDGQSYAEVSGDVKIKGVITGNDLGGNLYDQVSIQDSTGAIIVAISAGGLCGYLPVGQEVLINLKGLCVGNYGSQPEIGTPYTNATGATYVSRMSRNLWNTHFKLIGTPDASKVSAEIFDVSKISDAAYMKANCGKLMKLRNVTLEDADGVITYAEATTTNHAFKGLSSNSLVLRTSNYADFAAKALPQGSVTVTGIFTRYNNTWQILMRTEGDIQSY